MCRPSCQRTQDTSRANWLATGDTGHHARTESEALHTPDGHVLPSTPPDSQLRSKEDIHTLENPAKLPFTAKEELRESQLEHPPLGRHAVPMSRVVRIHSSSGTTGRPGYAGITRHDRDTWIESAARVYRSEGVRPDSIVVMGFGMSFLTARKCRGNWSSPTSTAHASRWCASARATAQ